MHRRTLYREGKILQRITHPHIIQQLEIIETDELLVLVMEACTNDFLTYLCANGKRSEDQARVYGRQLLSAIQHLHEHDVVHRDLKAENLLLDHDMNLKVIDFGLSNEMIGKDFLETQCGSLAYSAPELLNHKPYGKEVDIWSVGVCLYVLVTGKLPFGNCKDLTELHALMLDGNYILEDEMSKPLGDLFVRMFNFRPKNRITLAEIWQHEWLNVGASPETTSLYITGGSLRLADIDNSLVSQMVDQLGFESEADIIQSVLKNLCDATCATYHLLAQKRRTATRRRSSGSSSTGSRKSMGSKRGSSSSLSGMMGSMTARRGSRTRKNSLSSIGSNDNVLRDDARSAMSRRDSGKGNRHRVSVEDENGWPAFLVLFWRKRWSCSCRLYSILFFFLCTYAVCVQTGRIRRPLLMLQYVLCPGCYAPPPAARVNLIRR